MSIHEAPAITTESPIYRWYLTCLGGHTLRAVYVRPRTGLFGSVVYRRRYVLVR